jgi:hypothetical protein
MQRDAVLARAEDRVHESRPADGGAPPTRARALLQAATAGSRKYRQRVRCRMFQPIVAMLRSCGEAPASSASRTNGRRSATVASAASSSIVASAPTRNTRRRSIGRLIAVAATRAGSFCR